MANRYETYLTKIKIEYSSFLKNYTQDIYHFKLNTKFIRMIPFPQINAILNVQIDLFPRNYVLSNNFICFQKMFSRSIFSIFAKTNIFLSMTQLKIMYHFLDDRERSGTKYLEISLIAIQSFGNISCWFHLSIYNFSAQVL